MNLKRYRLYTKNLFALLKSIIYFCVVKSYLCHQKIKRQANLFVSVIISYCVVAYLFIYLTLRFRLFNYTLLYSATGKCKPHNHTGITMRSVLYTFNSFKCIAWMRGIIPIQPKPMRELNLKQNFLVRDNLPYLGVRGHFLLPHLNSNLT